MNSYNKDYYERNKDSISERRKSRYRDDPEYREKVKERAKKYKEDNPVSRATVFVPDEYVMTLVEAATQLEINISTLRDWIKLEMLPQPAKYGTVYYLTEQQFKLVEQMADFVKTYGARSARQSTQFAELKEYIAANWG